MKIKWKSTGLELIHGLSAIYLSLNLSSNSKELEIHKNENRVSGSWNDAACIAASRIKRNW